MHGSANTTTGCNRITPKCQSCASSKRFHARYTQSKPVKVDSNPAGSAVPSRHCVTKAGLLHPSRLGRAVPSQRGINTDTPCRLISHWLPHQDVLHRDSRPHLQFPHDGIDRLGFDLGATCLFSPWHSPPAQRGKVIGRRHQAQFHACPTYPGHPRIFGSISGISSPAARFLGAHCIQRVSPTGVDGEIRSPVTSRCLWD